MVAVGWLCVDVCGGCVCAGCVWLRVVGVCACMWLCEVAVCWLCVAGGEWWLCVADCGGCVCWLCVAECGGCVCLYVAVCGGYVVAVWWLNVYGCVCWLCMWLSVVDVCVGCVWLRGMLLTHVSNLHFSSAGGSEEGRRVKNRGAVLGRKSTAQPRARGGWVEKTAKECVFLVWIHLPLCVERECLAPW